MSDTDAPRSERVIGRYVLHGEVAAGGMATVHLGRFLGPAGFSRTVAIKRLHPQFAKDPEFVSMFLDEARLAARVRHPNVVSVLDVVAKEGELFLVMDYIQGESLARLLRTVSTRGEEIPTPVAVGIVSGALRGLHAAHEATSEHGMPLSLVHRDVSPHNILVGVDGVPNVVDFGVAKAANRFQTTREGQLKGKLGYMSPEQVQLERVDRRTDVYAASVVLWECLTGRRLFSGDDAGGVLAAILEGNIPNPSSLRPSLDPALDAIVMRGLSLLPENRFTTARDMAVALEDAQTAASPAKIGEWVERTAGEALHRRKRQVAAVESSSPVTPTDVRVAQLNIQEAPTITDMSSPEAALKEFVQPQTNTDATEAPTTADFLRPSTPAMSSSSSVHPTPQRRVLVASLLSGVLIAIVGIVVGWQRASAVVSPVVGVPNSPNSVLSPSLVGFSSPLPDESEANRRNRHQRDEHTLELADAGGLPSTSVAPDAALPTSNGRDAGSSMKLLVPSSSAKAKSNGFDALHRK